jgi:hypothetical protein
MRCSTTSGPLNTHPAAARQRRPELSDILDASSSIGEVGFDLRCCAPATLRLLRSDELLPAKVDLPVHLPACLQRPSSSSSAACRSPAASVETPICAPFLQQLLDRYVKVELPDIPQSLTRHRSPDRAATRRTASTMAALYRTVADPVNATGLRATPYTNCRH